MTPSLLHIFALAFAAPPDGSDALLVGADSLADSARLVPREARLESRVVTGHRPSPSRVRIDREELSRSATLGEALSRRPGVQVRTTGGLGGSSYASLRGSPGEQVEVTLDGVPLGGSTGSAIDLGPYALDGIERVEVRQATQSGSQGAPSIALVSRQGFLQRGASARVGSFGEQALAGWWSDAGNTLSLATWLERSENDWPFPWDNGTTYDRSDDVVTHLRGNDYEGLGATAAWRPDEDIQASLRWDTGEKGVSAPWLLEPSARWKRSALQGNALVATSLDPWRLEASAELRRSRSVWDDHSRALGWESSVRSEEEAWSARGRLSARRESQDWLQGRTSISVREERSSRVSVGRDEVPTTPDASRTTLAAEAGWEGRDPSDRVGFDVGFRQDWMSDALDSDRPLADWVEHSDDRDRTVRRANARFRYAPWNVLGLETGLSFTERAPDFSEWMGDNGAGLPNPGLESERTSQADLGARWEAAGFSLAATSWIARYEDPIGVVQRGSSPLSRHENLPGFLVRGLDLETSWRNPWLQVSGATTWQRARIESPLPLLDGSEPRRTPRWKACAEASVGPWSGLQTGWTLDVQGASWATELRTEDDRLSGRVLHGLWARWSHRGLALAAHLRNLTDEHAEDWADLPLSGRRFALTLQWNTTRHPGDSR